MVLRIFLWAEQSDLSNSYIWVRSSNFCCRESMCRFLDHRMKLLLLLAILLLSADGRPQSKDKSEENEAGSGETMATGEIQFCDKIMAIEQ